jgi:hypothetical protein
VVAPQQAKVERELPGGGKGGARRGGCCFDGCGSGSGRGSTLAGAARLLQCSSSPSPAYTPAPPHPPPPQLDTLKTALPLLRPPRGFEASLYHPDSLLESARSLALSGASAAGGPVIVYVSSRLANRTYALIDKAGDGVAEGALVLLDGLDTPQGLDWHE